MKRHTSCEVRHCRLRGSQPHTMYRTVDEPRVLSEGGARATAQSTLPRSEVDLARLCLLAALALLLLNGLPCCACEPRKHKFSFYYSAHQLQIRPQTETVGSVNCMHLCSGPTPSQVSSAQAPPTGIRSLLELLLSALPDELLPSPVLRFIGAPEGLKQAIMSCPLPTALSCPDKRSFEIRR